MNRNKNLPALEYNYVCLPRSRRICSSDKEDLHHDLQLKSTTCSKNEIPTPFLYFEKERKKNDEKNEREKTHANIRRRLRG